MLRPPRGRARPSAFFGDSLMRRLAATVASHLATPDGGRLDDDESLALLNYGEHTGALKAL